MMKTRNNPGCCLACEFEPECDTTTFHEGNCRMYRASRDQAYCGSRSVEVFTKAELSECDCLPCENGATCRPDFETYTCSCVPGFTGRNCETDIDECAIEPCRNGGTCIDRVNSFSCACPAGYTGPLCDTDINECESVPCLNGGTCIDQVNSFICLCTCFTGPRCESSIPVGTRIRFDLGCPREDDIRSPGHAIAALPGGAALVGDDRQIPNCVYHIDHQGAVIPPWFTATSTSRLTGILVDGDDIYITQLDGTISKTRLGGLDQVSRQVKADVEYMGYGCVLATDLLLLPDYWRNEILSFDVMSGVKEVKKSGLRGPMSASKTGSGSGVLYVVVELLTHRISVFDTTWGLLRSMGGQGSGDGMLDHPYQSVITVQNSVLVADNYNHRVSEFNLMSGAFIRHLLAGDDGIGWPRSLGSNGPYFWVNFYNQTSNTNTYNAMRYLFC